MATRRRVNLPEGGIASRTIERDVTGGRKRKREERERGEKGRVAWAHCLLGARLRVNNVTVTPGFVLAARNAGGFEEDRFCSSKSAA